MLSSLESFGAVLSRPDSPNKEFQKYLTENPGVDFAAQTFRNEPAKEEGMNLPGSFHGVRQSMTPGFGSRSL